MANQPKIPLDIIAIPQKIQRSKLQKCSLSKLTKIYFIPPRFTVHFLWGTPLDSRSNRLGAKNVLRDIHSRFTAGFIANCKA
jgi:hypothetical protein